MILVCKQCGKEFESVYSTRIYCGKECYHQAQREARKAWKNNQKNKSYSSPAISIEKMAKLAKEHGMTYGKFVAAVDSGKIKIGDDQTG